jgi:hypothetical protein
MSCGFIDVDFLRGELWKAYSGKINPLSAMKPFSKLKSNSRTTILCAK